MNSNGIQTLSTDDNNPNGSGESREFRFSRSYSGPIPPEDMLAGYEKVLPGSADRLISMAERQQRYEFRIRLLSPTINLLGLVLLVGLAAVFLLSGAPLIAAALGALTPTTIAVFGGVVTTWRTAQKALIERQRHSNTLRLESENHELDIQIRKEQHELDMRIKNDQHQLALEAGLERLSLPESTEQDDDRLDEDEDEDEDQQET